jgi:catalase
MTMAKLVIGLAVAFCALPSFARADDSTVGVEIVDAMNKVFGVHPGFRAVHAKGIVVEGHFRGSPQAQALSRAVLFQGATVPVTIRFSDDKGIPTIPDGSPDANPHGMAMKFRLPDGSEADMVTNSLKFFPVSTAADLRDLLLAVAESPPNAPKPTKVEQFVATHPTVATSSATAATPESFATENYFGLNAFILVNKAGERQAVRFAVMPERVVHLEPAEAAKRAPDFLMYELPDRIGRAPVTFRLQAQLAAPGDQTADPSRPWPEDRKVVDLGLITLEKAVAGSAEAEKQLLFLPGQVPDGIELSDDPMILIRNGAYAESFSRRNR